MTKFRVFKRSCDEKYKEGSYTSRDEAELRLIFFGNKKVECFKYSTFLLNLNQ